MKLPDVEPLSEARWDRIEHQVFASLEQSGAPARPAARGRVVLAAAFGASAAAAAAAALLFLRPAPSFTDTSPLRASRVETGAAPSTMTLGDATVRVDQESLVTFDGDAERGVRVVLERGSIACNVTPRAGRPAYVVQAGNVRVRVVGTAFRVARVGEGAQVSVDHGVVEVTANGAPRILRDGERFPSEPVTAIPSDVEAPSPVAGAGQPQVATDQGPSARTSVARTARKARGKDGGIVRELDDSPLLAPTARAEYEDAARLERSDPAAATRTYRRLAAGRDAWAANALFALARLEASLGHTQEALRVADEYLARYPGGLNAADARDLKARLR